MLQKIKRKKNLIGSLLLASSLSACGLISSGESPAQLDKAFYRDVAAGRVHRALKNVYLGTPPKTGKKAFVQEGDEKLGMSINMYRQKIKDNGGLLHIKVIRTEYNQEKNKATVTLELIFHNEKSTITKDHFIKVNGKWMITT